MQVPPAAAGGPSRGLTVVLPLVILRQRYLRIRRLRLEAIRGQPLLGWQETHNGVGRLARRVGIA
jgi:hypothetical protein